MTTYYLGYTKDGTLISRSSTRDSYRFAAVLGKRASFSATAEGAARNVTAYVPPEKQKLLEIIAVTTVDAAAYRVARKAAGDKQVTAG